MKPELGTVALTGLAVVSMSLSGYLLYALSCERASLVQEVEAGIRVGIESGVEEALSEQRVEQAGEAAARGMVSGLVDEAEQVLLARPEGEPGEQPPPAVVVQLGKAAGNTAELGVGLLEGFLEGFSSPPEQPLVEAEEEQGDERSER